MARVLVVGVATVDVVTSVEHYPQENSKVRASKREVRRGGNAANTAVVLARLGHAVSWAGVLVDAPETSVITDDFNRVGVDTAHAHRVAHGTPPTSYITLSMATGTRTIVHYRDAPEYPFECFARIDLGAYDWVHFEGRAINASTRMARGISAVQRARLTVSVEAETERPGIDSLMDCGDVVIVSKNFAQQRGHANTLGLLELMRDTHTGHIVVGADGEHGAHVLEQSGALSHSPAFPPPQVVDTVGAGDTLNAAFIDGRLRGLPVVQALNRACQIAGSKCGHAGFHFAIPC